MHFDFIVKVVERIVRHYVNFKMYVWEVCTRMDSDKKLIAHDYNRFLRCFLKVFIKRPIIFSITVLKILYIIIKYVIKFLILKIIFIPIILSVYFITNIFNGLVYFIVEFIYLFIELYILNFKRYLHIIRKSYVYLFYEDTLIEALEYEKSLIIPEPEKESNLPLAPDLWIYYPMRFALSSVLIRVTGLLLSVICLIILYCNFFSVYLFTGIAINDIEFLHNIKLVYAFQGYVVTLPGELVPPYRNEEVYNMETLKGVRKCLYVEIKTQIFVWYKVYYYSFIDFNELEYLFDIKPTILYFLKAIVIPIFFAILPLHIYYAFKHLHKTISIERVLIDFFITSYFYLKFIINISVPIFIKMYNIIKSKIPVMIYYSTGSFSITTKGEISGRLFKKPLDTITFKIKKKKD